MFKAIVLCQAVLIQVITGQCIGYNPISYPSSSCSCSSYDTISYPFSLNSISASSSSSFPVQSSSPISPTTLTISSDNVIEGPVSVIGQLPFLAAVGFDSTLPSSGYGMVDYSCGSGNVGIVGENYGGGSAGGYSGYISPASSLSSSGLRSGSSYYGGCGRKIGCGCQ